jgi:hypothetical protein
MKTVVLVAAAILDLGLGASTWAAPAGTLLFTQTGSQIVDAQGTTRPAKRGDVLQSGERLLTPPGGISQVVLPDGSLVGMRPGSDMKFDVNGSDLDRGTIVSLLKGTVRVIGSELTDPRKTSQFTLLSGPATLRLQGADLETAVVKPEAGQPSGNAPGSYNRLLIGTGSIGTGSAVEPLAPRQVSFVGAVNVAPVTLASVSRDLFAPPLALKQPDTGQPVPPATETPIPTKLSPGLMTSTLTVPLTGAGQPPIAARTSPTLVTGPAVVTAQIQPVTKTITPVILTPIVIPRPIITVVIPTPPPSKLPVISCKVLRTC